MLAAGLATIALLVSSCAIGPSERPPVAVRGSTAVDGPGQPPPPLPPPGPVVPPLRPGDSGAVGFVDCTQELRGYLPETTPPPDRELTYECADVAVGSDNSSGRVHRSSVGLLRISLADGSEQPKAPLLVLTDSDGESGSLRAAELANRVPRQLLENVDLVGMDRRGSGNSWLDCSPLDVRAELVDADLRDATPEDLDRVLGYVRSIVQECYLIEGEALTNYDTAHTARDVERVRTLLGVEHLSALGTGDGAKALAVWAQNHPGSVGRLVLDGPPDPTTDAIAAAKNRAAAAGATFDVFARECASREDCPLGPDPRADLRALADRLGEQPQLTEDGERLTGSAMLTAVLVGLDEPRQWPALAAAIGAAKAGDPTPMLVALDDVIGPLGRFDLALATDCNDTTQRVSPPQVLKLVERWQVEHPLFGALMAKRLMMCSAWPVPTDPAETGPAQGAPPMLVLGTAHSPRVPREGVQRAADQLIPARMVTWQGAGRTAYPRTPCVTEAVNALLVDGTVPQASVLCPP